MSTRKSAAPRIFRNTVVVSSLEEVCAFCVKLLGKKGKRCHVAVADENR